MKSTQPPAKRPCATCPYRRDCPSGLWSADEYDKLPEYDKPTHAQPFTAFLCHQDDGRLCAGWTATHDMTQSLGLRMASSVGALAPGTLVAAQDYTTDVPLFATGAEAAEHGKRHIDVPPAKARAAAQKIIRKRSRRQRA